MYYLCLYEFEPYFFIGAVTEHYISTIDLKTKISGIKQEGYELHITGESFNKFGYYVKTREYMIVEDKPIEITKEQFDMFKEEILKIQKLKNMFNTTATALYKSKSNASRTE